VRGPGRTGDPVHVKWRRQQGVAPLIPRTTRALRADKDQKQSVPGATHTDPEGRMVGATVIGTGRPESVEEA
jgi:hypothetical protein